jgi:hypothetical protein
MKILYKDGVKTICRDDHPDVEGYERIDIPEGYSITEKIMVDGIKTEVVKDMDVIKAELEVLAEQENPVA